MEYKRIIRFQYYRIMCKEKIDQVIPIEVEKFYNSNENTINRLEKIQIKLSYRKYLRIINNRIKSILAKDQVGDNNFNQNENELINLTDEHNLMDIVVRNAKRKLSAKDTEELSYDEFSINPTRENVTNDQ